MYRPEEVVVEALPLGAPLRLLAVRPEVARLAHSFLVGRVALRVVLRRVLEGAAVEGVGQMGLPQVLREKVGLLLVFIDFYQFFFKF